MTSLLPWAACSHRMDLPPAAALLRLTMAEHLVPSEASPSVSLFGITPWVSSSLIHPSLLLPFAPTSVPEILAFPKVLPRETFFPCSIYLFSLDSDR